MAILCSEFDKISRLKAQKYGKIRGSDHLWGSFRVKMNQKKLVRQCRNVSEPIKNEQHFQQISIEIKKSQSLKHFLCY